MMNNAYFSDANISVSVIIPAYNEEEYISNTLQAIHRHPPCDNYEIIVVDNGSTDNTPELVTENNASLLRREGSIASVRNYGVKQSSGEILVFIDSDVLVTEEWSKAMPSAITELKNSPMVVTGSRYLAPENGGWIIKNWFKRFTQYDANYINSGHLITTRTMFDSISGFSEQLNTAEDYDFCMKAKAQGGKIINNPALPVIHLGYPDSFKVLINRERWHGREDFETFSSFVKSKIGWLAAFNLLLGFYALYSAIVKMSFIPIIFYLSIMYLVSLTLTYYKFGNAHFWAQCQTAIIFYAYICGRSWAIIDRFTKKPEKYSA